MIIIYAALIFFRRFDRALIRMENIGSFDYIHACNIID